MPTRGAERLEIAERGVAALALREDVINMETGTRLAAVKAHVAVEINDLLTKLRGRISAAGGIEGNSEAFLEVFVHHVDNFAVPGSKASPTALAAEREVRVLGKFLANLNERVFAELPGDVVLPVVLGDIRQPVSAERVREDALLAIRCAKPKIHALEVVADGTTLGDVEAVALRFGPEIEFVDFLRRFNMRRQERNQRWSFPLVEARGRLAGTSV